MCPPSLCVNEPNMCEDCINEELIKQRCCGSAVTSSEGMVSVIWAYKSLMTDIYEQCVCCFRGACSLSLPWVWTGRV